MTDEPHNAVNDARLVASLLAIDAAHLGGVWVKARHGARRDWLQSLLSSIPLPRIRVTGGTDVQALFGGVDLTESLTQGRIVERKGLLATPSSVWLNGAERLERDLLAKIVLAGEINASHVLIAWDEGTDDDPLPPRMLRDRVAFFLFEDAIPSAVSSAVLDSDQICTASERLASVAITKDVVSVLVSLAERLGVYGMRPAQMAVYCARGLAALRGSTQIEEVDLQGAARLVFGHRITAAIEPAKDSASQPEVDRSESSDECESEPHVDGNAEVTLDAAATHLPDGLLAGLALRSKTAVGQGQGAAKISRERGRPLPSRPGQIGGRGRLDLLATLQAAAPMQKLRPSSPSGGLALRQEDFRIKRYRDRSERLLIFLVDASGSAAMARLAEAKGAVELMLAQAYEHRDSVCLALFRDVSSEIVLPPTRSLARAKKCLSAIPAGGATPLAHGLRTGLELATTARRQGQLATLVLMTDGRANRALDGTTDRAQAQSDAKALVSQIRRSGFPTVVLDTGRRTTSHVRELAESLAADVVALPSLRAQLARTEPASAG